MRSLSYNINFNVGDDKEKQLDRKDWRKGHTQSELRTDENTTPNKKLFVNGVSVGVLGELKEEWSDHSGSWRVGAVHTAMSLVEQGVVVWKERVADTKNCPTDVGH